MHVDNGYIPWLLLKMNSNMLGSLSLKCNLPGNDLLNNLRYAVSWVEESKHLFKELPLSPSILRYTEDEQKDIINKIGDLDNHITMPESDEEYNVLNDSIGFSCTSQEDFMSLLNIFSILQWDINCRLL